METAQAVVLLGVDPYKEKAVSSFTEFNAIPVLTDDVQYFKEMPDHSLAIREVLRNGENLDWRSVEKASINLGRSDTPTWVRFEVQNQTGDIIRRLLQIRWINLAKVDFYQVTEDNHWVHFSSGLKIPAHEQFRNDRTILFPIDLKAYSRTTIYLRVETSYLVFLPMYIWQEQSLNAYENVYYIWYALAFGILLAMMLYNASLYYFTKESTFFYYSAYVLGVIFYELAYTGIGPAFFWADNNWAKLNFFALSIYISFIFATMYIRIFLSLKNHGGWVLYFNNGLLGYWILMAITMLVFGDTWLRDSSELITVITLFGALVVGLYLGIKRRDISARYYTIAWGALVIFNVIAVWVFEGWLPYNFLVEYGQIAGFVLEVILLSFAMAERINRERQERALAQEKALELHAQFSDEREAKLQAQSEVLKVQQRTNKELERRVSERTAELESAMLKLESVNQELAMISVTDPLTKIYNRRHFDALFQMELQRGERTQRSVSLILMDIDHFKQFNDQYGHLVGDDCLKLVANTLQKMVIPSDFVLARFGGEEFAMILSDTDESEAMVFAESARQAIMNLNFIHQGKRIPISASFGIAGMIPSRSTTPETLIIKADKALYEAKDKGRNCCISANG